MRTSTYVVLASLVIAIAIASLSTRYAPGQSNLFPQTLPPNTTLGRLAIGSGPVQAIPNPLALNNLLTGSPSFTATFATTAAFTAATNILSTTTAVQVDQVSPGIACPLVYNRGTITATGQYGEVFAGGVYWEPRFSTAPVQACQFGIVSDGQYNFTGVTVTITGTDNAPAIQAALDYAMMNNYATVCLPDGGYVTGDTLHIGWGETFHHIELQSCARSQGSYAATSFASPGPELFPLKTDRCAINVQGGRTVRIDGISILGQNYPWILQIEANSLTSTTVATTSASGTGSTATLTYSGTTVYPVGSKITVAGVTPSGFNGTFIVTAWTQGSVSYASTATGPQTVAGTILPLGMPSTPAAWMNPSITPSGSNPGGIQQHSPYAGLCIDAFKGSAPTDAYPTTTYPSWTGLTPGQQYNLPASSDTTYKNGIIQGFGVSVMSSPNGDGNGDFTRVQDCTLAQSVYQFAVGNTQSRGVVLRNISFAGQYALATNRAFGLGQGQFGGILENLSGGEGYELYDINVGQAETFRATTVYSENQQIIGQFFGGAASQVFLKDHIITYGGGDEPGALIISASGLSFDIENLVTNYSRVPVLLNAPTSANLIIRGGNFSNAVRLASIQDANGGIEAVVNWTGGLFAGAILDPGNSIITPFGSLEWSGLVTGAIMTTPTGTPAYTGRLEPQITVNSSKVPLTQASRYFFNRWTSQRWEFSQPIPRPTTFTVASGFLSTALAYSGCDTVTFSVVGAIQTNSQRDIPVGSLIYFPSVIGGHTNPTATILAVTSVTQNGANYDFTATQLNNFVSNKLTGACVANDNVAGDLAMAAYVLPVNVSIPNTIEFGDCINGSTAVTNVSANGTFGTGNGTAGNFSGDISANSIAAGDRIWSYNTPSFTGTAEYAYKEFFAHGTTISSITAGSPTSQSGSAVLSTAAIATGRCPLFPLQLKGAGSFAAIDAVTFTNGATAVAQNTTSYEVNLSNATEANVLQPCPTTGVFVNLYVTSTAPAAGQTLVSTLRVNGSDTSLTCTITGTATSCSDTNAAHQAICTAGQTYSLKTVTSATTGSLTAVNASTQYLH